LLAIHGGTSNSLIENNILCFANEDLFVVNSGSTNVIAYNYLDSSWVNEGGNLQMADYGTHAEWPYMDLYEGNQATKYETGGVWGGASRLFFFRNHHDARHQWNCVTGSDPDPTGHNTSDRTCFQQQSLTAYNTFIGNVCGLEGDSALSYESFGQGSWNSVFFFRSGSGTQDHTTSFRGYTHNLTTGTTTWDDIPQGDTIPNSYYLTQKPSWWDDQSAPGYCRPWPPIGPDVAGYVVDIPAKDRFEGETYNGTPCPGPGPPSEPLDLHKE
jgi:hypothetical protein